MNVYLIVCDNYNASYSEADDQNVIDDDLVLGCDQGNYSVEAYE